MPVDSKIPFCEYFILPYFSWFLYVGITIIFIALTDGKTCWKLGLYLIIGMTIFLIISTIYPNGDYLRPDTFLRDNFCVDLVKKLYSMDTPTNIVPSLHVFNSLGIHIGICHTKYLKNKKGIRVASFCLMCLIILSTMFLKQHSVIDVIAAFLMFAVLYPVCFYLLPKKIKRLS